MNTKQTLTTLIAAMTLAAGGLAFAQANPPSSTAGAGCTATANAMRGGNLGGTATNKDCTSAGANTANTATTTTTTQAPAPMTSTTPTVTSNANTTAAPMASAEQAPAAPVRVARAARADRN